MTQVGPIFVARCGGCHGLADVAAANAFVRGNADRPSCVAQGARITAGNAANSLIVKKITGTQTCGAQMPFGCTPGVDCVPQNQIDLIRDWINAGAPAN